MSVFCWPQSLPWSYSWACPGCEPGFAKKDTTQKRKEWKLETETTKQRAKKHGHQMAISKKYKNSGKNASGASKHGFFYHPLYVWWSSCSSAITRQRSTMKPTKKHKVNLPNEKPALPCPALSCLVLPCLSRLGVEEKTIRGRKNCSAKPMMTNLSCQSSPWLYG